MIRLTGSRFQRINCLDRPQSSLRNARAHTHTHTHTHMIGNTWLFANVQWQSGCDVTLLFLQDKWFSRRAGWQRAKRIKNKTCPNVNNPVICVLSSHFLISNSWYCNVPLGVINTSCQTESDACQLEFNVISATNVRKLWFGLGSCGSA